MSRSSCPGQKGQLGPGTLGGNLVSGLTNPGCLQLSRTEGTTRTFGLWGGNLVSGLTRDVSSCPGQKGQLGPGTLGGNLVSGLTRDVSSCPGQKGQLGPGTLGGNLVSGLTREVQVQLSRTEGTTRTWDFGG